MKQKSVKNLVYLSMPDLLKYDITNFQVSKEFDVFGLIKMRNGTPLDPIEAEIEAIEKIKTLKQLNNELGINKPESYYKYKKLAFMEMGDMGLEVEDDHFFKDVFGNSIKTGLN